MSEVLATAVAICFLWSIVLFFASVFVQERSQEEGFGWALGGAVLFFVVFADRLPGHPTQLRKPLELLPGVGPNDVLFTSSLIALTAVLAVYLFRIAVFYQLIVREEGGAPKGDQQLANDIVAPPMSYFTFAICLVALIQPVYHLDVLGTVLISVALVVGYYGGVLPRLLRFLQNLWIELRVLAVQLRHWSERLVLEGVVLISIGEDLRRGERSRGIGSVATERLKKLKEREVNAHILRAELIAKAARPRGAKGTRKEGGASR